jgi:transposase
VIQIAPGVRVLVAVEPADFRRGIDGIVALCRERLMADPFSGALFIFRNRRGTAVKLLAYDGQGYWLCHKRLSRGRFRYWPRARDTMAAVSLRAHELSVLLAGGDPSMTEAAPDWRRVGAGG